MFKRAIFILLCLFITLSSFGCIGILVGLLADELSDGVDNEEPVKLEVLEPSPNHPKDSGKNIYDEPDMEDPTDEGLDFYVSDVYTLDMSSADAFIEDVQRSYDILLLDRGGYLSGSDGAALMFDLDHTLSLFSQVFIKALVSEYEEYNSRFYIILEGPSSTEFGMTEWDKDLTITLHYDKDPDENGITAAVLAHELAHAVHFVIEEYLGETRSENELRYFNGPFDYVEDDYDRIWDPDVHGLVFAYDYGMYDYYEDFATIIEMLVGFPEEMLERFNDPQHAALTAKTMYLREIMFYYISDAGFPLFTPLYIAEAFSRMAD